MRAIDTQLKMKTRPARSNTMTLSLSFLRDTYACEDQHRRKCATTVTHLRRLEPLVRSLEMIHGDIEFPKISVPKELVIDQVELPSSMRKAITITLSWEIHPSASQLHDRTSATYSG